MHRRMPVMRQRQILQPIRPLGQMPHELVNRHLQKVDAVSARQGLLVQSQSLRILTQDAIRARQVVHRPERLGMVGAKLVRINRAGSDQLLRGDVGLAQL